MMEYILSADKEGDVKGLDERLRELEETDAISQLHCFVTGDYAFVAQDDATIEYLRGIQGVIAIEPASAYFTSGPEGYDARR